MQTDQVLSDTLAAVRGLLRVERVMLSVGIEGTPALRLNGFVRFVRSRSASFKVVEKTLYLISVARCVISKLVNVKPVVNYNH